jgi:hypothetical protein
MVNGWRILVHSGFDCAANGLRSASVSSTVAAKPAGGVILNDTERLFAAVELGDAKAVARLLDEHPELVSVTRGSRMTPLHEAARLDRRAVVVTLIEHGADLEAVDDRHTGTPLAWAVFYGHADTARALLERGANPRPVDQYGNSPLYYTEPGKHGELEGWGPTAAPDDYDECALVLRGYIND